METQQKFIRFALSALAAGVLMTNGCALPHAEPRYPPIGRVSPLNYCPGETVSANYSLLASASATCVSRAGMDCSTIAPTLTISSTPASFPSQTFNSLTGGLTFMPTEASVDVSFAMPSSPTLVMYPIINSTTGAPGFASPYFTNKTHTTRRIDGNVNLMLTHGGMCAGTSPVYASAPISAGPDYSSNLQLRTVCNTNTVPITVTLTGAAGEFSYDLAVGTCFGLNEPGIPSGLGSSSAISARPQVIDPSLCRALEGSAPPVALTTGVSLACGM